MTQQNDSMYHMPGRRRDKWHWTQLASGGVVTVLGVIGLVLAIMSLSRHFTVSATLVTILGIALLFLGVRTMIWGWRGFPMGPLGKHPFDGFDEYQREEAEAEAAARRAADGVDDATASDGPGAEAARSIVDDAAETTSDSIEPEHPTL